MELPDVRGGFDGEHGRLTPPGPASQRTLTSSAPSPALRTAIDPYGVRSRSHAPDEYSPNGLSSGVTWRAGRRNPRDCAACAARTGRPVSPIGRDQISRPIRSSSARVRRSRRQLLGTEPEFGHRGGDHRPHGVRRGQPRLLPPAAAGRQHSRPTAAR